MISNFALLWQGEEVARIPIRALTKEAPAYQRPAARPANHEQIQQFDLSKLAEPSDLSAALKATAWRRRTSHRRNGFTANTIILFAPIRWSLPAPMPL